MKGLFAANRDEFHLLHCFHKSLLITFVNFVFSVYICVYFMHKFCESHDMHKLKMEFIKPSLSCIK